MRRLLCSTWIGMGCAVGVAVSLPAQQKSKTDAEMDGFSSAVKSVSTSVRRPPSTWVQPAGVGLAWPVACRDCDYAPDGSRMKAGQVENGRFQGRVISYERDGEGRVVRRRETDTNTGALMQEIEFGPYGRTGDTWYEGGKIRERDQLWYDANGHLSDVTSWDANGRESRRGHVVYSKDGELLDDTSWEHGVLAWHEHNDPVTKTETFTAFDEAGGVKLTRTIKDKKLVEFREPTPSMNEYGDSWYDSATPNDTVKISCHADGRCEHFAIHFEFLDAARRTPKSAEWRDESGKVLYAAYYEYELDAHGNWTHRKVFVTGPDLPERTLYEEDARTVTYWGR